MRLVFDEQNDFRQCVIHGSLDVAFRCIPAVVKPDRISTGYALQISVLQPDGRRFPPATVRWRTLVSAILAVPGATLNAYLSWGRLAGGA